MSAAGIVLFRFKLDTKWADMVAPAFLWAVAIALAFILAPKGFKARHRLPLIRSVFLTYLAFFAALIFAILPS